MFTTIALLEASTALEDRVSHLYNAILKLNPKFTKTDYIPLPLVGVFNGESDLYWVAGSPAVVKTALDKRLEDLVFTSGLEFAQEILTERQVGELLSIYEGVFYSQSEITDSEISPFISIPLNASNILMTFPEAASNVAHVANAEKFFAGTLTKSTSLSTLTTELPDLKKLTASELKIVFDNLFSEPVSHIETEHVGPTPNLMRSARYINVHGHMVYEFTPAVEPEIDFTEVGASYRASEADHADGPSDESEVENDAQRLDREFPDSAFSDLDDDDGGLDSGSHGMHGD